MIFNIKGLLQCSDNSSDLDWDWEWAHFLFLFPPKESTEQEMWTLKALKSSRVETPLIAAFHSILKLLRHFVEFKNKCVSCRKANTTMEISLNRNECHVFLFSVAWPIVYAEQREAHWVQLLWSIWASRSLTHLHCGSHRSSLQLQPCTTLSLQMHSRDSVVQSRSVCHDTLRVQFILCSQCILRAWSHMHKCTAIITGQSWPKLNWEGMLFFTSPLTLIGI